jgi:hypothetical protein
MVNQVLAQVVEKRTNHLLKMGIMIIMGKKTVRDIALGIPMTDLEYRERKLQAKRPSKEEAKIIPDQDSSQEEG